MNPSDPMFGRSAVLPEDAGLKTAERGARRWVGVDCRPQGSQITSTESVPPVGLEPTTYGLKVRSSAN